MKLTLMKLTLMKLMLMKLTLMSRWAKNPGVYASTYKGWDSTSPNLLQFFYARYLIFCPKRGY